MTIYIDLVLFINFMFDFNLLLTLNLLLKRRRKIKRIILGALIGSLSIFILFFNLNNLTLFMFKLIVSILMILITFGKTDYNTFKENLTYLYLLSVILGGSIYLINNHFGYSNNNFIFISKDYSVNLYLILFITPILMFFYLKDLQKLKNNYSKYYNVDILLKGEIIKVTAFLDTGNKLKDPITGKPVILVEKDLIPKKKYSIFYIPYNTVNHHNLLKCLKPDYIIIENKIIKNVIVGISENEFNIPGINCILNERILL